MRHWTTILILLFATLISCNTKTKPSVKAEVYRLDSIQKIVNNLGDGNIIGDNIGIAGSTYRFDLYKQLNKIATTNELITLTNHGNPAVRIYSFRALASRRSDKVFEILLNHINDTMHVVSVSGCTGMTETVRHNLIKIVKGENGDSDRYKLTERQSVMLDSILKEIPNPIY
jgi:hypothetical protein